MYAVSQIHFDRNSNMNHDPQQFMCCVANEKGLLHFYKNRTEENEYWDYVKFAPFLLDHQDRDYRFILILES